MAGVYRPRHPEHTVLYRVLFHYFDRFLAKYESRFEKEFDILRWVVGQGVRCSINSNGKSAGGLK
jgi:hypothetical protein